MSEIRVTKERVDHLMGTAEKQAMVCYAKHMILIAKLENGFVIETSSGCVDPKNFDEEIGEEICTKKLEDKASLPVSMPTSIATAENRSY